MLLLYTLLTVAGGFIVGQYNRMNQDMIHLKLFLKETSEQHWVKCSTSSIVGCSSCEGGESDLMCESFEFIEDCVVNHHELPRVGSYRV